MGARARGAALPGAGHGAAPRLADRRRPAARRRADRVPARMAAASGGDDAAVEPAAVCAVLASVRRAAVVRTYPRAAFLGGYASVWTTFGAAAFLGDVVSASGRAPFPVDRPADVAHHRSGARRRWCVPVLGGEGPVPAAVPSSRCVPAPSLRTRGRRRVPHGTTSRHVLSRLLLGPHAADVRRRRREPAVDGAARRRDVRGEDVQEEGPRSPPASGSRCWVSEGSCWRIRRGCRPRSVADGLALDRREAGG